VNSVRSVLLWWVLVPAPVVAPMTLLALVNPFWFVPLMLSAILGSIVPLLFTRDIRIEDQTLLTGSTPDIERESGPDAIPETTFGYVVRASTTVAAWSFVGVVVAVNLR